MVFLSNTAKGLMLDAIDESLAAGAKFASLHSAYSNSGANELSGGSPAYARKPLTWAAASGGSKALAATLPTFDVPAGAAPAWLGFWDAATLGTFLGMGPLGGGALKPIAAEAGDLAGNTLGSAAHGFAAGNAVVFWGAALPGGLVQGTIYYVIAAGLATNVFEVSATSGGAAVDITSVGAGFAQLIVPETFGGQGTYSISSGSLDLSGVA